MSHVCHKEGDSVLNQGGGVGSLKLPKYVYKSLFFGLKYPIFSAKSEKGGFTDLVLIVPYQ